MERMSAEEYRKKNVSYEEDDQIALAEILDEIKYHGRPLRWMHCPNEGKRKPQYIAKLRRMGLKPGFPDVIIFDPPPNFIYYRGAVIELKRKKGGKLSKEQLEWLIFFGNNNWAAEVCLGIDMAINLLKYWGYIE